eukprot:SAG22_NODE_1848_length_3446_cov_4.797132_4_plen_75_part_00
MSTATTIKEIHIENFRGRITVVVDANHTANDIDDANPCTLPGMPVSTRRPECGTPEVMVNTSVLAVTEDGMEAM